MGESFARVCQNQTTKRMDFDRPKGVLERHQFITWISRIGEVVTKVLLLLRPKEGSWFLVMQEQKKRPFGRSFANQD